jgi:hypothetical protein
MLSTYLFIKQLPCWLYKWLVVHMIRYNENARFWTYKHGANVLINVVQESRELYPFFEGGAWFHLVWYGVYVRLIWSLDAQETAVNHEKNDIQFYRLRADDVNSPKRELSAQKKLTIFLKEEDNPIVLIDLQFSTYYFNIIKDLSASKHHWPNCNSYYHITL